MKCMLVPGLCQCLVADRRHITRPHFGLVALAVRLKGYKYRNSGIGLLCTATISSFSLKCFRTLPSKSDGSDELQASGPFKLYELDLTVSRFERSYRD